MLIIISLLVTDYYDSISVARICYFNANNLWKLAEICRLQNVLGELADGLEKTKKWGASFFCDYFRVLFPELFSILLNWCSYTFVVLCVFVLDVLCLYHIWRQLCQVSLLQWCSRNSRHLIRQEIWPDLQILWVTWSRLGQWSPRPRPRMRENMWYCLCDIVVYVVSLLTWRSPSASRQLLLTLIVTFVLSCFMSGVAFFRLTGNCSNVYHWYQSSVNLIVFLTVFDSCARLF